MKYRLIIMLIACGLASLLPAQNVQTETYLGYAYPAGGSLNETFEVVLGGQYLSSPQAVIVNEPNIQIKVLQHYPPLRNLNGVRRAVINHRIAQRELELTDKAIPKGVTKAYEKLTEAELEKDKMPPSTLFEGIEAMDLQQINALKNTLKTFNTRQRNDQISEQVKIEVTIGPKAKLGIHEMRILSNAGLSNPIRFQVNQLPESREQEPNDGTSSYSPTSIIKSLPMVMNGQIMPGDVDRFLIRVAEERELHFDLMARRLIPYVADAVPGWFQATLAIYDGEGKRLAYIDDTYGDPDPSLSYHFTQPGNYIVEIRDAIYRGRENFVYRLFITDHQLPENVLRHTDVDYAAQQLPFMQEHEPNDTEKSIPTVPLPQVITGTIHQAKDRDHFRIHGTQGETIIAKVEARYFDSPLDSLVRIMDSEGNMLAFNDDYVDKRKHLHLGPGLMTHYADSYLAYELPKSGAYTISIEDAQNKGGPDYRYRLRLSHPQPDFEVRLSPSTLNIGPSSCAPVRIYINRIDGFTGPVELQLVDAPQGARLNNARIPEGRNEIWATLEWPATKRFVVGTLNIIAVSNTPEGELRHPVVPSDNSMQAFLWRHLLPAQELKVTSRTAYRQLLFAKQINPVELQFNDSDEQTVVLPLARKVKKGKQFHFQIKEGPETIELLSAKIIEQQKIKLVFKYTQPASTHITTGNLIIEAIDAQTNPKTKKARKTSIGVLPAIPFTLHTQ